MAFVSIRCSDQLGESFILAPERYDPRRAVEATDDSTRLKEIVRVLRNTVHELPTDKEAIVLDTCDAREGVITARKSRTNSIGSAKKFLSPGNVIISRLRPYLRQVAYVDSLIPNYSGALLCSTEFFVLESLNSQSIAFLVPFLLTEKVQTILAASQEGGHHPRFNESVLLNLPVPNEIIAARKKSSRIVEDAIKKFRASEAEILCEIDAANKAVSVMR